MSSLNTHTTSSALFLHNSKDFGWKLKDWYRFVRRLSGWNMAFVALLLQTACGGATSAPIPDPGGPGPTLVLIAVMPSATVFLPKERTQQYTATGTFSDDSTLDLTSTATWASSDPAVASISNSPGSKGLATGLSVGRTQITATDPSTGIVSSGVSLEVTDPTLESIAVQPAAPVPLTVGGTQQFFATGTFSDSSTLDLTTTTTWTSSDPAVASISNSTGSEGLATGVSLGSTQVTATDPSTGIVSPAVTLEVTDGGGGEQPVTSYTDALTDLNLRPEPALPLIGPAGSVFVDPTFGMRIVRLTDENTVLGTDFQGPSGAHSKMLNSDNTRVCVTATNGRLACMTLNPTTLAIGAPVVVPLQGDAPFFSYVDPDKLYGICSGSNDLCSYDFVLGASAVILDIDALALPTLTGFRSDVSGVSRDDRYIAWFGGANSQDSDMYVIRYDQQTGGWRALRSDTGELYVGNGSNPGTLAGVVTSNPGGFLHNARMGNSGEWIIFVGGSASTGIWEAGTPNTTILGTIFGHWAPGNAEWVYHCQMGDGGKWCVQPWPQAPPGTIVPATSPTPFEVAIDNHPSWLNDAAGLDVPICLATYRVDLTPIARAWDNEVICVATDTSDKVWRFAHTRTTGSAFQFKPRGNVSQDGRFYQFMSDWEGTLAGGRVEVFLVELK